MLEKIEKVIVSAMFSRLWNLVDIMFYINVVFLFLNGFANVFSACIIFLLYYLICDNIRIKSLLISMFPRKDDIFKEGE